jgi:c-di-GMP-binding flagellar brake protein YcgR
MGLREALRGFLKQHAQAKKGDLPDKDLSAYRDELEELVHALLAAQQAALEPGQKARSTVRVSQPVDVQLTFDGEKLATQTLNLSTGGFAIVLDEPPRIGTEVDVKLSLPGEEALLLHARAANARRSGDRARVGFQFRPMSDADADRLATLVFDAVLGHLKR